MIETIDPLITEVAAAATLERSVTVLVTGIADRLAGVTHPAEAHALANALTASADDLAAAVVTSRTADDAGDDAAF